MKRTLAAAAAGLILSAAPLAGQDVIMRGRVHGTQVPQSIRRTLAQDPNHFEFRRAWKGKVRRIRERRAGLRQGAARPWLTVPELTAAGAAVTGTLRVPIVLALYSDATAPYPASNYQATLFGDGGASYTLKTYYQELSRGVFQVDGTTHDWVQLPEPASYYEPPGNCGTPIYPDLANMNGCAGRFLRDALNALDPSVDLGQYDNDGPDGVPNSGDDDGYVDVAAFLYPTWGKACGGPGIWPHRWVYEAWWGAAYETDDASANGGFVKVSDYIIQGGVACDGASLMKIGTIAHELGHALDLPDLYATAETASSEGLGNWGLMASGSYNRLSSPAHMSAWSKVELGWMPVVTIGSDTIGLILDAAESTGAAIRIDHPAAPGEYFLLENRRAIGSDEFLPNTGLLLWHVDSAIIANRRTTNTVQNDPNHPGIDLEAADGLDDLILGANRGDAGDPFPGSTGNTSFNDASNPNARSYAGFTSGFGLANITEIGQVIALDILFGPPWGDVTEDGVVTVADAEAILLEVIGGASGANLALGDVDGDGDIDARDGLIVHTFALGLDVASCTECRVGEPVATAASAPVAHVRGVGADTVAARRIERIIGTGGRQQ